MNKFNEPWTTEWGGHIVDCNGKTVANTLTENKGVDEANQQAQRIVECVNAMSGLRDPGGIESIVVSPREVEKP